MSDFEKYRTQAEARRAAARRRSTSPVAEQAVLRHLGAELYKERRQAEEGAGQSTRRGH